MNLDCHDLRTPVSTVDGLASAFPVLDEFARELRQNGVSTDIERETNRQTDEWNAFLNSPTVLAIVKLSGRGRPAGAGSGKPVRIGANKESS